MRAKRHQAVRSYEIIVTWDWHPTLFIAIRVVLDAGAGGDEWANDVVAGLRRRAFASMP